MTDSKELKRRMYAKVHSLERDLQAYLVNLRIAAEQKRESVPLKDHIHIIQSFISFAESFESLVEEDIALG